MNKDLIFYYKRGEYTTADEIRNQITKDNKIEDVSFIIINEKYDGTEFIEYNKIYSTAINRDIAEQLIEKNKEKRILMYQRQMIPQFLKEKKIHINSRLHQLQNEIDELYKQRSMNINISKSDLLKNVGNKDISPVILIKDLSKANVPSDFKERPDAKKYSIIFKCGDKYSFLWNTPVLDRNPFDSDNSKFLNEITERRENITKILKGKQS